MAVGLALFVLFVGLVSGTPDGQLYPQPADPLPIEAAELVFPKYGATATLGKTTPEIAQVSDDLTAVFVTGGSKTVPQNFPYITNNYDDVELDQDLYVYYPNSLGWIRKEWPAAPRGRIFGNSFEYDGYVYVAMGGEPGVDRYFVDGNYWEALPDYNAAPSVRYGAASVQTDNEVYFFGGVDKETGETLNDFWVYDIETNEWTALASFPSARAGATLWAYWNDVAESLYLFGGQSADQTGLNDLWVYDINDDSWEFVNATNPPPARWGHFAFNTEYSEIFGVALGFSEDYSDVWFYRMQYNSWYHDIEGPKVATPAASVGYAAVDLQWVTGGFVEYFVFGGATDDLATPTEPVVWDREFEIMPEVWSYFGEVFFREGCYPGYVWDETACVLDEPEDDECDCNTDDLIRRTYVQEIEDKLITKKYSGFLRQCPAFWRKDVYQYADWFATFG